MSDLKPEVTKCRSCKAEIIWALTEKGKRIPLDAEPTTAGKMMIEPANESGTVWRARAVSPLFDITVETYMPHHATCPQGKEWRR